MQHLLKKEKGLQVAKTHFLYRPKNLLIQAALGLGLCSTQAALVHEYTFDSPDHYTDQVGNADLSVAGSSGTLTAQDGYITFVGQHDSDSVHLETDTTDIKNYDPFVLSIFFRISTRNQERYASIFSSNNQGGTGFQINFLNGKLSVNISASSGQVFDIIDTSAITLNDWHLLTIMQDTNANTGTVWYDDSLTLSTNSIFGELAAFKLGVNRNGNSLFDGDIGYVAVYNGEEWDDDKQDNSYTTTEVVPEPMAASFILLTGLLGFSVHRFWGKSITRA